MNLAAKTTWTRVSDPETAESLLPAWFASRMMATRGAYGFLLSTGDVVRVSRVLCVHVATTGAMLVDVLLDHAGVPDGVDTAWRSKHFLGAPVSGATLATLNVAQVVMAVEFEITEIVETVRDSGINRIVAAMPDDDDPTPHATEPMAVPQAQTIA